MMLKTMSPRWPAAVLSAALSVCFMPANAQSDTRPFNQTNGPIPSLRLVSEAPVQAAAAPTVTAEELESIANDAYIYAYPMVLMEVTRRAATNVASPIEGKAPMNQFGHRTAVPDARTPDVQMPSTDVLYSNLWFDVSRQPLIIRVPDAGGRYQSFTLLDMWTDAFASRGTRVNGNGAQTFAIVGPYWQGSLPAGVDVLRSPTSMGWLIGRVEVGGPADMAAVNQYQAALTATPYMPAPVRPMMPGAGDRQGSMGNMGSASMGRSGAMGQNAPLSASAGAAYRSGAADMNAAGGGWQGSTGPGTAASMSVDSQMPPTEQVANMDAATFFGIFAEAVRNNPPHANDNAMLDRLRRIGIGGTQPFQFARLDPAVQQALAQAAPEAGGRIRNAVYTLGVPKNNWVTVLNGIGTYGTDYLRRAAVAYAGMGANPPADVIYPLAFADADGKPFDAREDYVLHFDKGQLPPVDAFWSLNLYGKQFTFVENEADRYSLRSTDGLKYNPDGSLDIYIQARNPGEARHSNWLPTPKEGGFMLNMRLYSPKQIALDGGWAPPPVRRD